MRAGGSWTAFPDLEPEAVQSDPRGPWRTFDFLLFAMLPMTGVRVAGFPVSELAMVAAFGLGTNRRFKFTRSMPTWLVLLLPALVLWMAVSAQINDVTPVRRMLHLTLYAGLALLLADGRFSVRSLAPGLAAGLLVSAGAYFVGYGATYGSRLTGLMGDPNAAGYMLTVLGCLALAGISSVRARSLLAVVLLVCVVLTYSRTSLLAVVLILVWSLVGRRLASGLGVVLLAGMIWAVAHIPQDYKTFGPFADRTGSDQLRQRIVAAEHLQIAQAPWVGNGPGTSKVDVLGQTFFFHNSYLALQNEGGRIAQGILVLAGLGALVGLVRLGNAARNPWYEASLIAVAMCANNLGEVLLELPAAVALGLAAFHARTAGAAGSTASEAVPPPLGAPVDAAPRLPS